MNKLGLIQEKGTERVIGIKNTINNNRSAQYKNKQLRRALKALVHELSIEDLLDLFNIYSMSNKDIETIYIYKRENE